MKKDGYHQGQAWNTLAWRFLGRILLFFSNPNKNPVVGRLPIHMDQRDAEFLTARSGSWVQAVNGVCPEMVAEGENQGALLKKEIQIMGR